MIDYDVAWEYYNPNPAGKRVGDCVIRAICKATGKEALKYWKGLDNGLFWDNGKGLRTV